MPRKSTKTVTKTSTKVSSDNESCSSCSSSQRNQPTMFEYYAPEAKQVCVAGTFNNWDPSKTPLKKEKSGRWTIEVPLTPGRYEYKYVLDGSRWELDQRPCNTSSNPVGATNNVIEVKKTA